MRALFFNQPHDIDVKDFDLPALKDNEVLVKVGACGICGTDFHIFEGKAPAKYPVILGHEYAGVVADAGKNAGGLKPGDHVAINPNIHCGYCEQCRRGRINLCLNLKALGVTLNGGFADYSVVPVTQAHYVPQHLPFTEAAFAEPLSCCVHGINQASIKTGDKAVIVGTGTIGLLMMQLAILSGAGNVYAVETSEVKAEMALQLGASHVFNPSSPSFTEEFNVFTSGGADVVIECAGNEKAAQTALSLTRKGGTLVIFGLASPSAAIQIYLQQLFHNEMTIKSSILNPNTFQTAAGLLASGKIKTSQFAPQMIPLEDRMVQDVFKNRDNSVIKYMIKPDIKI